MAKLIEVTEEKDGEITHPTPLTKLYGVNQIRQVNDDSTGAKSLVSIGKKIRKKVRLVSEDQATVLGLMNGVGTNDAVQLTVNRYEGELPENAKQRTVSFDLDNVLDIREDPSDNTKSIMTYVDDKSQGLVIAYVDEAIAAIKAAANA